MELTEEEEFEFRLRLEEEDAAQQKPAEQVEEDPGLLTRITDTAVQGMSDMMSTMRGDTFGREGDPTQRDDMGGLERTGHALGGNFAPAVGDILGDALISGGQALLPKDAEEAIGETFTDVVSSAVESRPGQAIQGGLERWKEESPLSYNRAKDIAGIASVFAPTKISPKVSFGDEALAARKAGEKGLLRKAVARDIEPADRSKAPGTYRERGRVRRYEYDPTGPEIRMADELEKIEGYDPYRSTAFKLEKIEDTVEGMRSSLDESLIDAPKVKKSYIQSQIDTAKNELAELPFMVGDAAKASDKVTAKFDKLLAKYSQDGTIRAQDLLQARRDLDIWLKKNQPKIFNAETTGANQAAAGRIRQTINDIVNEVAPDQKVAESLQKQSDLLRVRDEFLPRLKGEAETGPGRLVAATEKEVGAAPPRSPLAATATAGSPLAMGLAATVTGAMAGKRAAGRGMRLTKASAKKALQEAINRGAPAAEIAALQAMLDEEE